MNIPQEQINTTWEEIERIKKEVEQKEDFQNGYNSLLELLINLIS